MPVNPPPRGLIILLGLACVLASGCGSLVQQSYREESPGAAAPPPVRDGSAVYASVDPEGDAAGLASDGYVRIGTSRFRTSGHVTFEQLKEQARGVGADIVLFSRTKAGSAVPVRPLVLNNDGTAHDLNPYVHLSGSVTLFSGNYGGSTSVGGGASEFHGKVTSSGIPGVSSEDMAFINADPFEYTASFWRKARAAPAPRD
jgi:hypothetical protein